MKYALPILAAFALTSGSEAFAQTDRAAPDGVDPARANGADPDAHTIWVGGNALDGSRILPGVETTRHRVTKDGVEESGYVEVQTVRHVIRGGVHSLVFERVIEREGKRVAHSRTTLDPETLAPIHYWSDDSWRGTTQVEVAGGQITGTVVSPEGEETPIDLSLEHPAFDAGTLNLVVRALPLDQGYSARLPVFSADDGVRWIDVEVTGMDWLKRADGSAVAVWVVDVGSPGQDGAQTLWIDKSDRTMLESRAAWGDMEVRGWSRFESTG